MYRFIAILIFLTFCSSGFCSDYFVDANNGSDLNSGLSSDDAWQTITYALSRVDAKEFDPSIIFISEGIYSPLSGEIFPLDMRDYVAMVGVGKKTCAGSYNACATHPWRQV